MKASKVIKYFGGTIAVLAAIVFVLAVTPFYYNYHLSPPAKLRDKIKVGHEYQHVLKEFEAYAKQHKGDEVEVTKGTTAKNDPMGRVVGMKYLHLYHWIFMDDLQLTVYFDKDNRVSNVDFIGD